MKKLCSLLALSALVLAPAAQAQDNAAVFRPSSAWAADYGDEYCGLIREFSDGKDTITVAFQRVQPGADTQLMLIGDTLKTFRGADQLGWHFLPNDSERKARFGRGVVGGKQYLRLDNVTLKPFAPPAPGSPFVPAKYDRAAEQTLAGTYDGVLISTGLTKPVRIETGSLGAPVGALQACTDDLLKTWGLDPEKHKTLSSPVVAPIGPGWIPNGTIPFTEFAKFAGGANQVRLLVDATGKATNCHIYSPTLDKALNDRICAMLMEKASFTPAKDAAGQPMASYWMGPPMAFGPPFTGGPGGGRGGR